MHLLEVKDIAKWFPGGENPAVDGVSFRVEPGEIFGMLGPSGCGKTTTLRIIAGFEKPDTGTISVQGQNITQSPPEKRSMGFIFQDYALFPHLTVQKNIRFALESTPKHLRDQRIGELLQMMELKGLADRYPHELSGGQQQRVAIARALAAQPTLLLMDEPFSNLDASLRDATRREIRGILKQAKINAILVTHDQEEALSFCDRVALMHRGRIEQIGTPEEVYHSPRTPFVAQFLGRSNMLKGKAQGNVATTDLGVIPINTESSGDVLISLRPEHLNLEPFTMSSESGIKGEVVSREFRGHDLTYRVKCGDRTYLSHMEYTKDYELGQQVLVQVREPGVILTYR